MGSGSNPIDWTKHTANLPKYYAPEKESGVFQGGIIAGATNAGLSTKSESRAFGGFVGGVGEGSSRYLVGVYSYSQHGGWPGYTTEEKKIESTAPFVGAEGNAVLLQDVTKNKGWDISAQAKATIGPSKKYDLNETEEMFFPKATLIPASTLYAGLQASVRLPLQDTAVDVFSRVGISSHNLNTVQPVATLGASARISPKTRITAEIVGTTYKTPSGVSQQEFFDQYNAAIKAMDTSQQQEFKRLKAQYYPNAQWFESLKGNPNLPAAKEVFSAEQFAPYANAINGDGTKRINAMSGVVTFETKLGKNDEIGVHVKAGANLTVQQTVALSGSQKIDPAAYQQWSLIGDVPSITGHEMGHHQIKLDAATIKAGVTFSPSQIFLPE